MFMNSMEDGRGNPGSRPWTFKTGENPGKPWTFGDYEFQLRAVLFQAVVVGGRQLGWNQTVGWPGANPARKPLGSTVFTVQ